VKVTITEPPTTPYSNRKKHSFNLIFLLILIFVGIGTSQADFSRKYCEMDGAYTESGEYVYGECYRDSGRYCEMDGAYTESGDAVYGKCYIFH